MVQKVLLRDDGIIYQTFSDPLSETELIEVLEPLKKYSTELKKSGKPVLVLANLINITKADSKARNQAITNVKSIDLTKMAGVVKSRYLMHMGNWIIKGGELGPKVKLFTTEQEAELWLKS